MLAIVETHPVQYHAPVYRAVQEELGIPVTAIYASDFSVAGALDPEFNVRVAWDVDLLGGYGVRFLRRVAEGGARNSAEASARGLRMALRELTPRATLLVGYSPAFHQHAFFAARAHGGALLFRGETTDHATRRTPLRGWIRDAFLRRFYRGFARLLYVGERSREHLHRLGASDDRLVFSPYCVDARVFDASDVHRDTLRSQTRRELDLDPAVPVVLFSGKLSERKGVRVLVEALKMLPTDARPAIVFLGDGQLGDELRQAVRTGPRVVARFPGFRNQSELSRYFHAADLLVLPSLRSETWGLVVNEALHHGLPCVVSDAVGCAPDLIVPGGTGEVCTAGDRDALAAAIGRGLALGGRSATRAACRERISAYSVRAAAAGLARAYRESQA